MDFEKLKKEFSVSERIEVTKGEGEIPVIHLHHVNGSKAEIYLVGATVTSYKTSKGEEMIFVSSKAIYKEGKAIRGGIPICFPQFGPGALPQHGFARNQFWKVKSTSATSDKVQVVFFLADNEETHKVWNHSFHVEYTVTLHSTKLSTELSVTNNNSSESFSFTACLHNYFRIQDVSKASVTPLKGLTYIDKVQGGKQCTEGSDAVTFTGETDRVYANAPSQIGIHDQSSKIEYRLETSGFNDCVVWNPSATKAKDIADLGADEWKVFVCAEAGAISTPITLKPQQNWKAIQHLSKL